MPLVMRQPIAFAYNEANLVDPHAVRRPANSSPELHQFRFSLRQLLVAIAIISVLCAAIATSSVLGATVIVFVATIVATHVFATVVGTRLQSQTNSANPFNADRYETADSNQDSIQPCSIPKSSPAQPRSPWHICGRTAIPGLCRVVAGTAILGGSIGAGCLAPMVGDQVSPVGIIVGGSSTAVLCGWVAFLFGNFYCVFRHGFRDAAMQCDPHTRRLPRRSLHPLEGEKATGPLDISCGTVKAIEVRRRAQRESAAATSCTLLAITSS